MFTTMISRGNIESNNNLLFSNNTLHFLGATLVNLAVRWQQYACIQCSYRYCRPAARAIIINTVETDFGIYNTYFVFLLCI